MDMINQKNDLLCAYEAWSEFEKFQKLEDMTIEEYVMEFTRLYIRLQKHRLEIPKSVLTFKLLDCAKMTNMDRLLVLTGVKFVDKESLYDQMSEAPTRFLGKCSIPTALTTQMGQSVIKQTHY